MKKATIVVPPPFTEGKIFDLNDPKLNRDDFLAFFHFLREQFRIRGYDLSTQDVNPVELSDVVIYRDVPKALPDIKNQSKSFLFLFESEVIRPDNFDKLNHRGYRKIFTWHDDLVDNYVYFKFNFAHLRPSIFNLWTSRSRFIALIAANKFVDHPFELYSKRAQTIQWFTNHHPEDLDLYGFGWDSISINVQAKNIFQKIINKSAPHLGFLRQRTLSCYKGSVKSKTETLKQYEFAICYENARSIPGYITEKIFDCFFSGTIPVYWGAPNMTAHIPKECFVDRTAFPSHEELWRYLKQMSAEEKFGYQRAIQDFLQSPAFDPYDAEKVAIHVCEEILKTDT